MTVGRSKPTPVAFATPPTVAMLLLATSVAVPARPWTSRGSPGLRVRSGADTLTGPADAVMALAAGAMLRTAANKATADRPTDAPLRRSRASPRIVEA